MEPTAIVCAYSPVGTAALEGLLAAGIRVLALYTYPQGPDESWFEAPEALARPCGIPVHHAADFNADAVFEHLQALRPDFLFSFYFREMIQARFLELPRLGAYNLHGSLLPRYRGRAPLNWVLVNGETETGLTLHAMTPRPDDGDLVAQSRLPIAWDETALSLTLRAAEAARDLVRTAIPGLVAGTAPRIAQKTLGASTYFGGRKPEDSRLSFGLTAREAFNQIRAVADPWPNAFLETEAGRLKVPWALPTALPCPVGHFRETPEGAVVGFAEGALRLIALRRGTLRSERPTEHAAWLRHLGIPEAR
ncbi:MAG: Bifunctional polymyxin resistance protein ArnA [Acidobacteria bacterium ADurb.Bin340]|nr:MAG: Bifunctional polymyxin resistance protein ArnA [Acidobacteria bacterium ADurb.Bin340]HQL48367.1 formyltransferase family protein [Holophaga sp.]